MLTTSLSISFTTCSTIIGVSSVLILWKRSVKAARAFALLSWDSSFFFSSSSKSFANARSCFKKSILLIRFCSIRSRSSSNFSANFLKLGSPLCSPNLNRSIFSTSTIFFSRAFSSSRTASITSASTTKSSSGVPMSIVSMLRCIISMVLAPSKVQIRLPPLTGRTL